MATLRFIGTEVHTLDTDEAMSYLWCRDLVKSPADYDEYVVDGFTYQEYMAYCRAQDAQMETWYESMGLLTRIQPLLRKSLWRLMPKALTWVNTYISV